MIKLLLTSAGVTNQSIKVALVELLGKPISESKALFVPTGVYPFVNGANYAWWPIAGKKQSALVGLGWETMGLLEFTALFSIEREIWLPALQDADALLVWGGDPLYLSYWFEKIGLAEVLALLNKDLVYVGVSAGSMAVCTLFGETYSSPRGASGTPLTSETVVFSSTEGDFNKTFVTANGADLVGFSVIPHFENPDFADACGHNAELWASKLAVPVYAIDDQSAIIVVQGQVEIVSEGRWMLFDNVSDCA